MLLLPHESAELARLLTALFDSATLQLSCSAKCALPKSPGVAGNASPFLWNVASVNRVPSALQGELDFLANNWPFSPSQ